jgi:hypothetical protein
VVIEVQHAAPLVSPAYDDGMMTEAYIVEAHRARFARLHEQRAHFYLHDAFGLNRAPEVRHP